MTVLASHHAAGDENLEEKAAAAEPVGFDGVSRCAKVSGGTDAFERRKPFSMKGTIQVTPNGGVAAPKVSGTIENYFVAPDRAKVTVNLGQFGRSERGVRSPVAWESSAAGN